MHDVVTTPEADEQIRLIDAWWRANRSAAVELFAQELAAAFDLLAGAPDIGRSYRVAGLTGVRRVLLRATRYHVYYRQDENAVVVLAVWHARRGMPPPLT